MRQRDLKRKDCLICEDIVENLPHFINECISLDSRRPHDWIQKRIKVGHIEVTEVILFKSEDWISTSNYLEDMWNLRDYNEKLKGER